MNFAEYTEQFNNVEEALAAARAAGASVNKYADPLEGEQLDLDSAEALSVAREDVNLLWLDRVICPYTGQVLGVPKGSPYYVE